MFTTTDSDDEQYYPIESKLPFYTLKRSLPKAMLLSECWPQTHSHRSIDTHNAHKRVPYLPCQLPERTI